ncbi:alpha/beta fold hydrolase [Microlunatus soli]|uniref:Pimeloyl-ACP methyl ester carboxylesterase n=1 Tax=Microlunatus soli TaxID=630515 RepID=A0A1H1WIL0_9ACTN|nr:alpha/beta hydrolase [Microlunatus soli]SDS96963.1 Pimeloyl-ACP methyl ester carboxylesterase [Microlunatus soli]
MRLDQELSWRGRRVRWTRFGSGPPLVMCHGTPWSSVVWDRYAVALSAGFTVHLWDMPGYGQSSMDPDHAVDLGVQGELLADLVEHWRLDRPHVVAHDFGGAVSLRAHLLHGTEYSSLALVDVVALRPWGSPFFRLVAEHADVFEQLPAAIHRGALEAYIAGAAYRRLATDDLDDLTAPWLTDQGRAAFYRQIAQADECFTAEVEDRYRELTVPTKIIWGRQDSWIPVDRADRLARMIPAAELEMIDDAGHLITYDAPVALMAALERWLSGR